MAQAGDVIEHPVRGERIVFIETARGSDGALLKIEVDVGPRSRGAGGDHFHPSSEERFEVLQGRIRVRLDGLERDLAPGEVAVVAAGHVHTFWNPFDEPAKVAVEVRPALRMETLAETDFGLARDGKCTKQGEMRLLQAAVTLTEFAPELQVPQRPVRWLLAILAPIGRAFGYRPYYEAFGTPPDVTESKGTRARS